MIAPPDVVLVATEFGVDARFELDVRRSLAGKLEADLAAQRIELARQGES